MTILKYLGLVILGMLLWSALLNGFLVMSTPAEEVHSVPGCLTPTCWS